jgi:hypothetical protein
MGLAQVHVNPMTSAAAFADDWRQSASGDGDAHAGAVGNAPSRSLLLANWAFHLRDALERDRFTLPAVKTKDAVGLCDYNPTFDVAELLTRLLTLLNVGPVEGLAEFCDLV